MSHFASISSSVRSYMLPGTFSRRPGGADARNATIFNSRVDSKRG